MNPPKKLTHLVLTCLLIAACSSSIDNPPATLTASTTTSTAAAPTATLPAPTPVATIDALTRDLLDVFTAIQPEQTSQAEVETLLGEPSNTANDGENSLKWDYHISESPHILLRVRFYSDTLIVRRTSFQDTLTVADMLETFGPPAVVYLLDVGEEPTGDNFARTFFAYPEQGVAAYVTRAEAQMEDVLEELYRFTPQSVEAHLEEASQYRAIKIIDWP